MKGAARWTGRSLLIWGDAGYEVVPLPDVKSQTALFSDRTQVVSGAVCDSPSGPLFAALRANGIDFFQPSGDTLLQIGSYATPGAREVAFLPPLLIVRTNAAIEAVDIAQPAYPSRVGIYQAAGILRVIPPITLSRGPAIALETNSGGMILDLRDPAHPVEILRTPASPWFADLARAGHIFARVDANRTSISVYENESRVEELRRL